MKIDLPSFDDHLHIENFFDWVTEVERFFDIYIYIYKYSRGKKCEVGGIQIQKKSTRLVGTVIALSILTREGTCDFLVKNEMVTQCLVLTTKL